MGLCNPVAVGCVVCGINDEVLIMTYLVGTVKIIFGQPHIREVIQDRTFLFQVHESQRDKAYELNGQEVEFKLKIEEAKNKEGQVVVNHYALIKKLI